MDKINEIDITLTVQQMDSFSKSLTKEPGLLSPFCAGSLEPPSTEYNAKEITSYPGEFSLLVSSLLDPEAAVGLSIILQDELIDTSIFYPHETTFNSAVSISQEESHLRIQQPAPLAEIISLLQQETDSAPQNDLFNELDFKSNTALLWWALLDLISLHGPNGLTLPVLQQHLENSAEGMDTLAGYARVILDLNSADEDIIIQSVNELIQKGCLSIGQNGTFVPANWITELAAQFQTDKSFISLTTSVLNEKQMFGTVRLYFIQPVGGTFVLWFWVDDKVTILSLTTENAISMITQILASPSSFYQTAMS